MNHIGPYLLSRIRAREGLIEIWEGQDTITGSPVLVYRPLEGAAPTFRIPGTLNWMGREGDAWVAELPFGAAPLAQRAGEASPNELTAWTRRLLSTLLEMRALGVAHGRLDPERLWVKGEEIWIEGVGLPLPVTTPDEAALVATLRDVAGDTWPGWPFHRVLERLAEGTVDLREAAELLSEPRSVYELEVVDEVADEPDDATEPTPDPATGTVRVIGRSKTPPAASEPPKPDEPGAAPASPEEPPPALPEEPPPVSPDAEPEAPAMEPPGEVPQEPDPKRPGDPHPIDPSRVVRIDDVSEPAFEVIEPNAPRRGAQRRFLRIGAISLLLLLLAGFTYWWKGRAPAPETSEGYPVEFRVEPSDGRAELVLLDAPESSQLVRGRVLAIIPGKVYFDAPGIYRIQIRATGFLPQEKLLSVPPSTPSVTVRLGP